MGLAGGGNMPNSFLICAELNTCFIKSNQIGFASDIKWEMFSREC